MTTLEMTSYKYLGNDIHHKLNWNYSIEKMIIGGWKVIMGLETIVNQLIFRVGIRRNSSLSYSCYTFYSLWM
jgi:hypothetical protein